MLTPRDSSPFGLIQERLRDDPWQMLVACIMLNQTSIVQVKPIFENFMKIWPDALSCSQALPELVANVIKPLGLYNRRAKILVKMSQVYVAGEFVDPDDLPGIGKYGADSYRIFITGTLVDDVQDKELRRYVDWAKSIQQTCTT